MGPAREKLYPVLDDLLADWQSHFVPEYQGIRVIGYQYSPKSHEVKDFLAGNLISYQWLDVEKNDKGCELLALHDIQEKDLPAIFFEDDSFLTDPTISALAEKVGHEAGGRQQFVRCSNHRGGSGRTGCRRLRQLGRTEDAAG